MKEHPYKNTGDGAVLEVSRLRIERDDTVILRDVSWTVRPGQHWAILGANASGKTSLLQSLAAYLTPTAGDISVLGEKFGSTDWRELRKRIGLVTSALRQEIPDHEPALETIISGRYAMIDYWGKVREEDRKKAQAILRRVKSVPLAERPWRVLSQGERQRILIGRALMAEPPLLILDEPCAGLDPVARERFLHFLQELAGKRNGPSLILVTHHIEEIMPEFTHVLLLKAGKVMAAGEKKSVLQTELLSRAFGAPVRVRRTRGRYAMEVAADGRAVF